MSQKTISRKSNISSDYKWGFVSDVNSEIAPKGLSEDIIRMISKKKNEPEFLLNSRLKAYEYWKKQKDVSIVELKFKKSDDYIVNFMTEIRSRYRMSQISKYTHGLQL